MKITCIIPSTLLKKVTPSLSKCLDSLNKAKGLMELRIFVVASSPWPVLIKRNKAKLLKINFISFSQINNDAIERTLKYPSDYYLFINDDAWLEKDFFRKLVKAVKVKPEILVPFIKTAKGDKIDSFGIEYFTSGYAKNSNYLLTKTELAPAACLLVKTSFLIKMKLSYGFYFNEILDSYLEDVEFSIRARGLGAKINKTENLIAYHMGSVSFGKKSRYVMFQTYRNIIWVILMTWPLKAILKNIISIIIVQGWVMFYGTVSYGPALYLKVITSTFLNLSKLLSLRKNIISAYGNSFKFQSVLSKYTFRTYHGKTIKI